MCDIACNIEDDVGCQPRREPELVADGIDPVIEFVHEVDVTST